MHQSYVTTALLPSYGDGRGIAGLMCETEMVTNDLYINWTTYWIKNCLIPHFSGYPTFHTNESRHDKTNKMSVRPAKTQISLGVRMKKPWAFSYLLNTQRRLIRLGGCPGWSESSLGTHSFCGFCRVVAQMLSTQYHPRTSEYNWAASRENLPSRVCDQVRHKPACSATQRHLEFLISKGIILFRQRITMALIRLRGCSGCSAHLTWLNCIS